MALVWRTGDDDRLQADDSSSEWGSHSDDDDYAPDLAHDGERPAGVATDAASAEVAQPSGRYNPYDALSKRSSNGQQPGTHAHRQAELQLDEADLDLMESINMAGAKLHTLARMSGHERHVPVCM